MKVIFEGEDGPTIVYGIKEFTVETSKGLVGEPIPEEEGTLGFRFREESNDVEM